MHTRALPLGSARIRIVGTSQIYDRRLAAARLAYPCHPSRPLQDLQGVLPAVVTSYLLTTLS